MKVTYYEGNVIRNYY